MDQNSPPKNLDFSIERISARCQQVFAFHSDSISWSVKQADSESTSNLSVIVTSSRPLSPPQN